MPKFKVNIIEHGERQVEIEAKTEYDAIEKAEEMYRNGNIRMDGLGDNDYVDYLIDRC